MRSLFSTALALCLSLPFMAAGQESTPPPVAEALSWDDTVKELNAKPGETEVHFSFAVTNASNAEVQITQVVTSCGCTAARLPPLPWRLGPGEGGIIPVTMNIAGKQGTVAKQVTIYSSAGIKPLLVRVNIPAVAATPVMGNRERNLQVAAADRQAVFKNDCASCHAAPTVGKIGERLYVAACGICHDAEHRASMVPDLRALQHETTEGYWKTWITHGKPGTLMPAFGRSSGGPLSDEQIESLVEYMTREFSRHPSKLAHEPRDR